MCPGRLPTHEPKRKKKKRVSPGKSRVSLIKSVSQAPVVPFNKQASNPPRIQRHPPFPINSSIPRTSEHRLFAASLLVARDLFDTGSKLQDPSSQPLDVLSTEYSPQRTFPHDGKTAALVVEHVRSALLRRTTPPVKASWPSSLLCTMVQGRGRGGC